MSELQTGWLADSVSPRLDG